MAQVYPMSFSDATRPARDIRAHHQLAYCHSVTLPEGVEASYEVASPVLRLVAGLIDLLVLVGVLIVIQIVLVILSLSLFRNGDMAMALVYFGVGVVTLGYFFISEYFWHGRTLGKKAMGLRVIGEDGEEAPVAGCLARSMFRFLELALPFLLLIMFFDRRHRRLGDMLAGTMVVHDRNVHGNLQRKALAEYMQLERHWFSLNAEELSRLSPDDFASLEEFGRRLPSALPERRAELAMITAYALAQKMQYRHPITPDRAERFVYEVHCALNSQMRQLYPDLYS